MKTRYYSLFFINIIQIYKYSCECYEYLITISSIWIVICRFGLYGPV